ncbi:MAG: NTP pyrophosphatase (non-canonical NTP hydrolase) [Candidatus Saccharimonadales bacterium]|jgi:NTP pyrophosphatase (non-canonical NTP hydrolase)
MTIKNFQHWVGQSWIDYKGALPDKHLQMLFLVEEFGEVAEAIRKTQGDKDYKKTKIDLEEEMGDFLISFNTIAVEQGVDLEKAAKKAKQKIIDRHGG